MIHSSHTPRAGNRASFFPSLPTVRADRRVTPPLCHPFFKAAVELNPNAPPFTLVVVVVVYLFVYAGY